MKNNMRIRCLYDIHVCLFASTCVCIYYIYIYIMLYIYTSICIYSMCIWWGGGGEGLCGGSHLNIYIYIGELTSLQQFVKTRSSDASYCLHTTCEERKKEAKIYHHLPTIHSLKLTVRPSKWMVGRRLSYWRGLFSGAISFREGKSINDYSLGQRTMK